MIKNYFEKIGSNIYGQELPNKGATIKQIEMCEKRLGLSLPVPLKEMYEVFGNDKEIFNAYHSFISLDDLQIIDGAIVFYELIDQYRRYGIMVEDINKDDPKVKLQQENNSSWYFESKSLSEYILNNIFWQGINLMKIKAKIEIKEEDLEKNLQNILYKISEERKLSRGTKYSYYDKEEKVMATYFHYDQLLILGSNDKNKLKEVENNMQASFEWIERKITNDDIFN
ncbi:SMI1/KNR4 family protein [Clostridium estertheticum]|uniref:SMI1/KNR4 family protein n=1 Tax=Clostridium estertheticum TaxID=238834 RepID=UPI001CF3E660|nr:SMI1/KNR4 family protein [Clostridium estertheticum]MCB2362152.1 SMI1/KNR4 family protein [Clostridium estertheticum]